MGRDWRIKVLPFEIAHSISCGEPKCDSIRLPRETRSPIWESSREGRLCLAGSMSRVRLCPSWRYIPFVLTPILLSAITMGSFLQTNRSGVTMPETIDSPSPQLDSITASSFFPLTGFAVKSTPDESEGTISWTTTAIHPSRLGTLALCLYEIALAFQ